MDHPSGFGRRLRQRDGAKHLGNRRRHHLHLTNHNDRATLDGGATSLTATGAIADDDPKPVVSVAGPAGELSYVSENVKDPVTFTLTLMGQSAGDVTVDYATGEAGLLGLLTSRQGPAGATEDEDYAGASGTVTFISGQTTKTVAVQVTDDDVSEETEFFGFKISRPKARTSGDSGPRLWPTWVSWTTMRGVRPSIPPPLAWTSRRPGRPR